MTANKTKIKDKHLFNILPLIFAFLIILNPVYSQILQYEPLEENVLRVNGSSSLDVKYDVAVITLELLVLGNSQLTTLDSLGRLGDMLVLSLVENGIAKKEDIKTTRFQSDQNVTFDRPTMEQKIEYAGNQSFEVVLEANSEYIISVLNILSSNNLPATYNLNFRVSSEKNMIIEKELNRLAFEDAKTQANELAESGEFEVLGIRSINYNNRRPQNLYEIVKTRGNPVQNGPSFGGVEIPSETMNKIIGVDYNIKPL